MYLIFVIDHLHLANILQTISRFKLTRYLFVLKIVNFLHKGLMKAITLLADIVNNSKTETIMIISKTQ